MPITNQTTTCQNALNGVATLIQRFWWMNISREIQWDLELRFMIALFAIVTQWIYRESKKKKVTKEVVQVDMYMTTIGKCMEPLLRLVTRDTSGDGKSGRLRYPEQPVTTGTPRLPLAVWPSPHPLCVISLSSPLIDHTTLQKNLFLKNALTIAFSSLKNWPPDIQPPTQATVVGVGTAIVIGVEGLQCLAGPCFTKAGTMSNQSNEYPARSGNILAEFSGAVLMGLLCRNVRLPRMTQGSLASQLQDHQRV